MDIEYGLMRGGRPVDIAVTTERYTHRLRIFSLPDMAAVDDALGYVYYSDEAAGVRKYFADPDAGADVAKGWNE